MMINDLISRQAAIEAINDCVSADSYDFNNGLCCAMFAIADIPSVQRARLLTFDELKSSCGYIDIVWIDGILPHTTMPVYLYYMANNSCRFKMFGCSNPLAVLQSDYGKYWRCWSARPSDEQVFTTPWESTDTE